MNTADDDMSEADRGWDDDDDGMVDYTDEPGSGGNPSKRKAGPDDDVYVDYTGESDTGEVWDDGGDLLDRAEEPDAAGNTSKRRPRKRRCVSFMVSLRFTLANTLFQPSLPHRRRTVQEVEREFRETKQEGLSTRPQLPL